MGLIQTINTKIKKMDVYDISLTKLSVLCATLFLVTFFPRLASLDWYWYLIGVAIFAIRPLMKLFS